MASLDWQRLRRLTPYLGRDRRRLVLTLVLLLPLALAAAVQPLLVGQAIAVLRGEPTLHWLEGMPIPVALRILVGLLLAAVAVRLSLQSLQTYNVQAIGQRLTARIRDDLFRHSLACRCASTTAPPWASCSPASPAMWTPWPRCSAAAPSGCSPIW